jgi:hypothetical protein
MSIFYRKKKNCLSAVLFIYYCIYKPDSVIDSYLSCLVVANKIFASLPHKVDTDLHTGKDLAVSPSCCHEIIPLGNPSSFESGVTARTSRLLLVGVTHYHAPTKSRVCPDFPLRRATIRCLYSVYYLTYIVKYA